MGYQLLIFDWDGTLMDSAQKIANCIRASARDLALTPPDEQACKNIIGLGLTEAMVSLFDHVDGAPIKQLVERYRHHWLVADTTPQQLFNGVIAGLTELNQAGPLLSIATGKSRSGLDSAFADLPLGHLFAASRCADETRSKPNPQMIEELLALTAIESTKAVMIGDTSYDMEMAANAGIDAVGVSYGVHTEQTLVETGATHVAHTFDELKAWLLEGRLEPAYSDHE